jgi:hypothetical protein
MARYESDREDLLAEAIALVRRAEWLPPAPAASVLLGERDNGWFSIYLGQDRYYQFDSDDRLRRAYVAPALFRTQGATLARLIRDRTADATVLQRTDLSAAELEIFRVELRQTLQDLRQTLQRSDVRPLRYVPQHDESVAGELADRLIRISSIERNDWLAPAIRGKR